MSAMERRARIVQRAPRGINVQMVSVVAQRLIAMTATPAPMMRATKPQVVLTKMPVLK
jgi:hypothetical protein